MQTATESTWDAIVLGAGISGLVTASVLVRQGLKRVLVIDEYAWLGGNHIHRHIGPYTFDIGIFAFQEDSPLIRHFPELLEVYQPIEFTSSRVIPDGSLRHYPFSFQQEVIEAGVVEWVRMLSSLIYARLRPGKIANAYEYACSRLGSRVVERSGLVNYIERFHGGKATEIDTTFAAKRMMVVTERTSLRYQWRRKFGPKTPHRHVTNYVRPRGGFNELYDRVAEKLATQGVVFSLGKRMLSVAKQDAGFRVRTAEFDAVAPRLIATIPVSRTLEICGLPVDSTFATATLVSLFVSFKGNRNFGSEVFYNFSREGQWKRVTMFSEFWGRAEGREYFAVEVNCTDSNAQVDPEQLFRDFQQDIRAKDFFAGDLRLEGSNILENGYPLYREGQAASVAKARKALEHLGIESFGRQGGFDYLPTAQHVTRVVEEQLRNVA